MVYFRETWRMQSFMKIELSRKGEKTLSFTDVSKSCQSREFLTWQICLLRVFAKKNLAKMFEFYIAI